MGNLFGELAVPSCLTIRGGLPEISLNDFGLIKDNFGIRYELSKTIGYYMPITENIEALVEVCKNKVVCEVGAGSGLLTAHLGSLGVDITAFDLEVPTYSFTEDYTSVITTEDVRLDIISSGAEVVIMSWPDYDTSFASEIAKSLVGTDIILITLGESSGGCTGDDEYFSLIHEYFIHYPAYEERLNLSYDRWYGIHDYWTVVRSRPIQRLPLDEKLCIGKED